MRIFKGFIFLAQRINKNIPKSKDSNTTL